MRDDRVFQRERAQLKMVLAGNGLQVTTTEK
jgi:hypothetical protein